MAILTVFAANFNEVKIVAFTGRSVPLSKEGVENYQFHTR